MTRKRNPYIRIVEAYDMGRGVVLTAEEVRFMRFDSSIETIASETSNGAVIEGGGFNITKTGFVPTKAPTA